ncbi:ABC transporter ATP-binding protein [Rhizobium sp.]
MTHLRIRGLAKRFGEVTALGGVDLDVGEKSRTAIVGPSGSGKTTLLRLIAGFDRPDAGSITIGGETIADGATMLPAHKRGIGVIAQDGALFPHLDVGDNIGFGIDRDASDRQAHIEQLADTVGLPKSMLRRRPDQISGGQQQRVAIARALARKPRLMLLDEPFSALDTSLRGAMRKAVGDILDAAGVTSILVTHDQAEALSFADQVAVMNNGTLEQAGAPRDLYFRPKSAMVAEFLGECIILPARLENGFANCIFGRLDVFEEDNQPASQLMIRPEQIDMRRNGPGGSEGCAAEVTGIEFAGPQCLVMLELKPGPDAPLVLMPKRAQIVLHGSAYALPEPGENVWLTVKGRVHPLR